MMMASTEGALAFVKGLIFLPARLLGGPRPA